MKKIEIYRSKRPIKVKKTKLKQPTVMDIDFSSIHQLVGNKTILENTFQLTKTECLNG
jgi:hypothetical protein